MKKLTSIACALLLFSVLFPPRPALAAHGTPDSPHFGYGVRIDVNGPYAQDALHQASVMGLNWVALDFDWNAVWPQPAAGHESTPFGRAAHLANSLGLNLVFSISNPPAWAMTTLGPHPDLTAALLVDLKRSYPHLQAVELYPRSNTRAGWGAAPDARQYTTLFETAQNRIGKEGLSLYLLAGGLTNRPAIKGDIVDTVFLQSLYDAGLSPAIISLNLDELRGDVLAEPAQDHLRHLEQLRKVMHTNGASADLLWVSGLTIPGEVSLQGQQAESKWLTAAYQTLRSQLYLGSALYQCYNPSTILVSQSCLIQTDGSEHPFLAQLRILIGKN